MGLTVPARPTYSLLESSLYIPLLIFFCLNCLPYYSIPTGQGAFTLFLFPTCPTHCLIPWPSEFASFGPWVFYYCSFNLAWLCLWVGPWILTLDLFNNLLQLYALFTRETWERLGLGRDPHSNVLCYGGIRRGDNSDDPHLSVLLPRTWESSASIFSSSLSWVFDLKNPSSC